MIENFKLRSSYDGLDISVIAVVPAGETKAVLQLAHGLCGSKERYIPFMEYMASIGVACVANDHRGHGESVRRPEDLGYMYSGGHKALIDDFYVVSKWISTRFASLPVFLLGHSMGSMVVRAYLKETDPYIEGVVLCGSPEPNPFAQAGYLICSLMCLIGLGRCRPKISQHLTSDSYNHDFISEGPNAWVCSDPEVRKVFSDDPKHNFILTFNGGKALTGLMLRTYAYGRRKTQHQDIPVLFISGEDDPCSGGESGLLKAVLAVREYGYRNIRMKRYPAMRHEVLNEIGKERVWQDIVDFIMA